MQTTDFLARVLPPKGIYYAGSIPPGNKGYKQTKEIPTLAKLGDITNSIAVKNSTYYATGTFKPGTSREAKDVLFKKAFYLDLDVKENDQKCYSTFAELWSAWKVFVAQSGILPPTMLVKTGHGLHIYWVLEEPIPAGQWQKIATLLKRVTEHLKLKVDPSVTADLARILRLPGTTNYKFPDDPRPCEVFHALPDDYTTVEFLGSISKWASKIPKAALQSVPAGGYGVEALNGATIPLSLQTAAKDVKMIEGGYANNYFKYGKASCKILGDMLKVGGAGYDNNAWKSALCILTFCEDGRDFVHPISEGYEGYTRGKTESMWTKRIKYQELGGLPIQCSTLQADCGVDDCKNCEGRQQYEARTGEKMKNPLFLFRDPLEGVLLPSGFSQSLGKGIWYTAPNQNLEDGEAPARIKICGFNIESMEQIYDTSSTDEQAIILKFVVRIGRGTREITIDHAILCDYRKLYTELSKQRITINPNMSRGMHFGGFMGSWAQELTDSGTVSETQSKSGWILNGKSSGFSVGGTTYWDNGTISSSVSTTRTILAEYAVKGELEPWKKAVQFALDQGRQQTNLVIAASFGAPLMEFTEAAGLVLSLLSECSASGKSASILLGGSIWGNPQTCYQKMNDTVNATSHRIASIVNLPCYWDEVRGKSVEESFGDFVFSFCLGQDKKRLTADIKERYSGSWRSLMITTSNMSLIDHVDRANPNESDAGRVRILEFQVPHITSAQQKGNMILSDINDNYGHAGRAYAEYLGKNRDAIKVRVRKAQEAIKHTLKCAPEERFWYSGMAATIVGAKIANELGLLNIDIPALQKFYSQLIIDSRNSIDRFIANTVVSATGEIGMFINDMRGSGVSYEDMDVNGNIIGSSLAEGMGADNHSIAFEYGVASNRMKINKKLFAEWLRHHRKQLTDSLRKIEASHTFFVDKTCRFGQESSGTYGVEVPAFIIDLP